MSYSESACDDAKETASEFIDEMIEATMRGDEVSSDLNNDYPNGDSYHHESHVDKEYDLQEASTLLSELSDHEETDSGLWEGLEPRKAIAAQAAYTYGNAVMSEWSDLIDHINEEDALSAIRDHVVSELDSKEEIAACEALVKAILTRILTEY